MAERYLARARLAARQALIDCLADKPKAKQLLAGPVSRINDIRDPGVRLQAAASYEQVYVQLLREDHAALTDSATGALEQMADLAGVPDQIDLVELAGAYLLDNDAYEQLVMTEGFTLDPPLLAVDCAILDYLDEQADHHRSQLAGLMVKPAQEIVTKCIASRRQLRAASGSFKPDEKLQRLRRISETLERIGSAPKSPHRRGPIVVPLRPDKNQPKS